MEWGGGRWLPYAAWARFDGAPDARVDVDAILALFDPVAYDGPIVVYFLPMLDHKKCSKLKYGKPLATQEINQQLLKRDTT